MKYFKHKIDSQWQDRNQRIDFHNDFYYHQNYICQNSRRAQVNSGICGRSVDLVDCQRQKYQRYIRKRKTGRVGLMDFGTAGEREGLGVNRKPATGEIFIFLNFPKSRILWHIFSMG